MKPEQLPALRCTRNFKTAIERLSKERNESVTDFVRRTLEDAIREEFGDNWEAVVTWRPESTFLLEAR